jgi:hypothetical protein|tara:strand:- start:1353 stop:1628 length:276 start_codon:yes stop_codon:yes gene_type:complete
MPKKHRRTKGRRSPTQQRRGSVEREAPPLLGVLSPRRVKKKKKASSNNTADSQMFARLKKKKDGGVGTSRARWTMGILWCCGVQHVIYVIM